MKEVFPDTARVSDDGHLLVGGCDTVELTERFGGLTAHMRAPARGVWKTEDGDEARDDIVIFEVMTDRVDRDWWDAYRKRLQDRFRQDAIVIRAMAISVI